MNKDAIDSATKTHASVLIQEIKIRIRYCAFASPSQIIIVILGWPKYNSDILSNSDN